MAERYYAVILSSRLKPWISLTNKPGDNNRRTVAQLGYWRHVKAETKMEFKLAVLEITGCK